MFKNIFLFKRPTKPSFTKKPCGGIAGQEGRTAGRRRRRGRVRGRGTGGSGLDVQTVQTPGSYSLQVSTLLLYFNGSPDPDLIKGQSR
jgi:hypothetical protein